MNDKLKSTIRHVLTFAGGFVIAKGWITPEVSDELIGGLITVVGAVWSIVKSHKSDKEKVG